MHIRRYLVASLLALGCQTSPPVADRLQPTPESGQSSESAPLAFAGTLPPVPVAPVVGPDGCVQQGEADAFLQAQRELRIATERKRAAEQGWRELKEFATGDVVQDAVYLHSMQLEIRKAKRGMFVDQNGERWLAVEEYGCSSADVRYYIDARKQVFEVNSSQTCDSTSKMSVCGMWAMGGCGVEPPRTLLFAKVPRGARLLEQPANIEVPLQHCVSFEPTDGYSYPP